MDEWLESIRKQYNKPQFERIKKAYEFANDHHTGQTRKSGEPYFIHPSEVARILTDIRLDDETIVAALLHDLVEDTDVTSEVIEAEFGHDVAELVDGVTKLERLEFTSREERQAENLRKMLLAVAKDPRVVMIKLADRMHNMRTLEFMPKDRQQAIAQETMEIYAPLAHRLGIYNFKWQLEDLAFQYLEPQAYSDLMEQLTMRRHERELYIEQIIDQLQKELSHHRLNARIDGRPKHAYSIYKKMVLQNKPLDQIFDLIAVRVIVRSQEDCYAVLGVVHTLWKSIPGRYKDYISVPKPNHYQSLHTTVIGSKGQPFEVQIRTEEMHRAAEYGIAAHWRYKEGRSNRDTTDVDKKLTWLRSLMEEAQVGELADPSEFMETLKIDFFSEEVFVFTPKGDVIDLPTDSTPLDFAYAIHSAVGNKCVGAKVNGRIIPLTTPLVTGDIVEILTSSASRGPSWDWLKIVKTTQAKNKIRAWFKKEFKEENTVKGKEMLERDSKRQGFTLNQLLKEGDGLDSVMQKNSFQNVDDIYAAVGYGAMTVSQVMARLVENAKREQRKAQEEETQRTILESGLEWGDEDTHVSENGVLIKGVGNVAVHMSRCCSPVPGDEIVGYVTRGRGVSIHRSDCSNLQNIDDDARLIEASWAQSDKAAYNVQIRIIATERPGVIADITNTISDMHLFMQSINARNMKNRTLHVNISLEISNTAQLEHVTRRFEGIRDVLEVYRVIA